MIYRDLPLIEHPPAAGLTEELTFASDTRKSHDGHEERIRLRERPRMLLTVSHPISDPKVTEINALISVSWDEWWVPIWNLAKQFVPDTSDPASTTVVFDSADSVTDAGFQPDGSTNVPVLIQNGVNTWVTGASITGNGITFSPNRVLNANKPNFLAYWNASIHCVGESLWFIVSLRKGQTVSQRGFQGSGFDDILEITFDVDDVPSPAAVEPRVKLDNKIEVLTVSSQEDQRDEEQEDEERIDDLLGKREIIKDWERPERQTNYSRILWLGGVNPEFAETHWLRYADDLHDFRRFIWRRGGRSIAFIEPSFRRDLDISVVVGNTITLNTRGSSSTEILVALEQNPFVAVRFKDGSMKAYHLDMSGRGVTGNIITGAIPTPAITTEEIANIEFASMATISRLSADRIDVEYTGNEMAAVNIKLTSTNPVRQGPAEGVVQIGGQYFFIGEDDA